MLQNPHQRKVLRDAALGLRHVVREQVDVVGASEAQHHLGLAGGNAGEVGEGLQRVRNVDHALALQAGRTGSKEINREIAGNPIPPRDPRIQPKGVLVVVVGGQQAPPRIAEDGQHIALALA